MDERLERYAELAVRVGANVQPGQEVFVHGLVEHADVVRALTRQSYRAGASYVNVTYEDQHVRRAMIELGPDEALTYSPEWLKTVARATAGNAQLGTAGNPEPELLADLDGERNRQVAADLGCPFVVLDVTDRVALTWQAEGETAEAMRQYGALVAGEVLAEEMREEPPVGQPVASPDGAPTGSVVHDPDLGLRFSVTRL